MLFLERSQKRQYVPKTYENGETRRQLLARSVHLLLMHSSKWTEVQQKRADVLFRLYPDIKECYDRYLELVQIYNLKTDHRPTLMTKLASQTILNYFDNRSTNASAESFNAKVKASGLRRSLPDARHRSRQIRRPAAQRKLRSSAQRLLSLLCASNAQKTIRAKHRARSKIVTI
ncbi:MAG: transposase [Candidatus Cryptobacteroides sp.]